MTDRSDRERGMIADTLPAKGAEEWRPIPSIRGDLASSRGRVMGVFGRVLSLKRRPSGYMLFSVADGRGRSRNISVARAVCEAFNGPPPSGAQVDHIDRIRDNDEPSNLRWVTKAENLARRVHRNGEGHHNSKLDSAAVAVIRHSTKRSAELATEYGVAPRTIRDARSRKLWRHVDA